MREEHKTTTMVVAADGTKWVESQLVVEEVERGRKREAVCQDRSVEKFVVQLEDERLMGRSTW